LKGSLNLYVYSTNNPNKLIDPLGLKEEEEGYDCSQISKWEPMPLYISKPPEPILLYTEKGKDAWVLTGVENAMPYLAYGGDVADAGCMCKWEYRGKVDINHYKTMIPHQAKFKCVNRCPVYKDREVIRFKDLPKYFEKPILPDQIYAPKTKTTVYFQYNNQTRCTCEGTPPSGIKIGSSLN